MQSGIFIVEQRGMVPLAIALSEQTMRLEISAALD